MSYSEPKFSFSIIVQVRFADMDALGHVNNATFLTYFEEARMAYCLNLFPLDLDNVRSLNLILAEACVKFHAPARVADRLEVFCCISHIGNKSFQMDYRVLNAMTDMLICEGHTIQVMYDYEIGATMPVPEEMRKKIEQFENHVLTNP